MNTINLAYALESVEHLKKLIDETGDFINHYQNQPAENSRASDEIHSFQRSESIHTAFDQGTILIEVTADQINAFIRTVSEPVLTISPWTCIRSALESSALATWLLNPKIDAKIRVQRSLAFRYEGQIQQLKFINATKDDTTSLLVQKRIDEVEQISINLGYPKVKNKKGERIGIGQIMPSITEIIKENLDKEDLYRLLSAIAHAHTWALQQASFHIINDTNPKNQAIPETGLSLEKHLLPESLLLLCKNAGIAIAKPLWSKCQVFGWDANQLKSIFTTQLDAMGIKFTQES